MQVNCNIHCINKCVFVVVQHPWFTFYFLFFGYGNVIMNTSLEKQKYITVITTERSPILSVIIQAINKVVGV